MSYGPAFVAGGEVIGATHWNPKFYIVADKKYYRWNAYQGPKTTYENREIQRDRRRDRETEIEKERERERKKEKERERERSMLACTVWYST